LNASEKESILSKARQNLSNNQKYFKKLKKHKKALDKEVHPLHDEVFAEVDCLTCANCCITTGPMLINSDIERIAKYLKKKPAQFIKEYVNIDEDGDYVFHSMPCPFLGSDNYCMIYEARPKACREYPHTNRKNQHQLLNRTLKNTLICPAVNKIFDRLKKVIPE
jgi:uncharacterized protein